MPFLHRIVAGCIYSKRRYCMCFRPASPAKQENKGWRARPSTLTAQRSARAVAQRFRALAPPPGAPGVKAPGAVPSPSVTGSPKAPASAPKMPPVARTQEARSSPRSARVGQHSAEGPPPLGMALPRHSQREPAAGDRPNGDRTCRGNRRQDIPRHLGSDALGVVPMCSSTEKLTTLSLSSCAVS